MPVAMNISHDSSSARAAGVGSPRKAPVFSARYNRIALLSNTGIPSSRMAGVLPFGFTAR